MSEPPVGTSPGFNFCYYCEMSPFTVHSSSCSTFLLSEVKYMNKLMMFTCVLPCREFLGQGWMKLDKTERTPYIMKTSQHFNDVSLPWSVL